MSDFLKKAKERLTYIIKGGEDENVSDKPNKPEMISVLMQDGSIKTYPENFRITDGVNCAVCISNEYHTHLDCQCLKNERITGQVKGMYVSEAKKQGMIQCWNCKDLDKLYEDD